MTERLSRTQRDLQRLDGRRGPRETHAVVWGDLDQLVLDIAARFGASTRLAAQAGVTTSTDFSDFESEILAAIAADQAALDAANARIDTTLTYVDNEVQLARDAAAQAVNDALAEIDALRGVVAYEKLAAESTQSLVDDMALSLSFLAARIQQTDQRVADAGIYVDPETATVRIAALEQTDNRISVAELRIDAAEGEIISRVTFAEMNQAISEAMLDPTQIPLLDDLNLRVQTVEEELDAVTATLTSKASVADVDGLDVRLSSAETSIDGLEAEIILKASASELTEVESRVTNAEFQINTLDGPSITQTVYQARSNFDALDETNLRTLQDLLDAYLERQAISVDLASARTELMATVNGDRVATAGQFLALQTAIDLNSAAITQESITRTSEDDALAAILTSLSADVDVNSAAITQESIARVDADQALATDISELSTDFNGLSATVSANATAISTLEGFAAATYTIRVGAGGASAGFEIVAADDPVNGPESVIRFTADSIIADGTIYGRHVFADTLTSYHILAGSIDAISINVADLAGDTAFLNSLTVTDANIANLSAAKIFGDLTSNNYSAGLSGWIIRANGTAEFNSVTIRRQIEVASGTINVGNFSIPFGTDFGDNSDLNPDFALLLKTVFARSTPIPITEWQGATKTYIATAGMTGTVIEQSGEAPDVYWGWYATVLPLTRWSGDQTLRLKLDFWGRNVRDVQNCIVTWKIYEVS